MKHLKYFENINTNNIEIGDFVLFNYPDHVTQTYICLLDHNIRNFINNNIAVIVEILDDNIWIEVNYEDVTEDPIMQSPQYSYKFNNNKIILQKKYIEYKSKNKEDVEAYLNSKKYNL